VAPWSVIKILQRLDLFGGMEAKRARGSRLSIMPADRDVLTVQFQMNFLKPAKTERVIAVGQVVQSGRTLTGR
jgi:hypothetical protein